MRTATKRTPERQRLADAIERRARTEQALAEDRQAKERIQASLAEIEAEHAASTEALADAQARLATEIAQAARGGAPPSAATKSARARLADAEDRLVATRRASEVIRTTLAGAEEELRRAEAAIAQAAGAVLGTLAPDLIADIEHDTLALVRKRSALRHLWLGGMIPIEHRPATAAAMAPVFLPTLDRQVHNDAEKAWERAGGADELKAALKALQRDADAPLP